MGATVIRTSGSEGASCGSASMCEIANGFLQVFPHRAYSSAEGERSFPTGRAISAEGGVAVHRGADHVELPD